MSAVKRLQLAGLSNAPDSHAVRGCGAYAPAMEPKPPRELTRLAIGAGAFEAY